MALDVVMVAGMLKLLPLVSPVISIVIDLAIILFFGSIALIGYKGYLSGIRKLGMRLFFGLVCFMGGVALAPFIPIGDQLLKLMVGSLIGDAISAAVIAVALRLMTLNLPYSLVLREKIKVLQDKLDKRSDRDAKVPNDRTLEPATVAGILVFLGFIVFSLLNFHGFPDIMKDTMSAMGLGDKELAEISALASQYENSPLANMSAACRSSVSLLGVSGLTDTVYEDQALKAIIETKENDTVSEMYKMESNGKVLINAALSSGKHCYTTQTEFCYCP